MAARVIPDSVIEETDPTAQQGSVDTIDLQDCAAIARAFERASHFSVNEASIFAPITKHIESMRSWSQVNQQVLGSWFATPKTQDSEDSATKSTGLKIENTFTAVADDDFGDALKKVYKDCVPCSDRIDLLATFNPGKDLLDIFRVDIEQKIAFLTDLDSLLSDVNVYGDICRLIGFLNFMCVPDLQKMVSVLMALMMKFNLSLDGLFSLIMTIVAPLFSPLIASIANLLSQYELLVLNPINCVIDSADDVLARLSFEIGESGSADDLRPVRERLLSAQERTNVGVQTGLGLLRNKLFDADQLLRNRLTFYLDQLNKLTGDWNGDSTTYLTQSLDKLQIVRLIALVQAIIDIIRTGGQLCLAGEIPTESELNAFFGNFLNPNSFFQLTVDDDGNLRIEEPGPITYRLEDEEDGVKIIPYEPENLLQVPVQVTTECSILANPADVDTINRWIRELDKVRN